tara:strand:- start:1114 stop:1920 length:807 start_codon:yes stop_codon:yes gene_type:complete
MKIAVCYSGFLRNIQKTFPNIVSKMLKTHDVDFFFHTWNVEEYQNEIEYSKNNIRPKLFLNENQKNFERNPYYFINSKITSDEYLCQLKQSSENKKFFPIPSEENNFKFYKDLEVVKFGFYSSFPYNFLSQFYSFYKAIELKKIYEQNNNFEYDCVIRIRPDVYLYDDIHLEDLNLNVLNVFDAPFHKGTKFTVNDHFASSSSKLMDIYGECFLYLSTYYFTYGIDFIQEIILGKHLEFNCIEINKMSTNYLITRDTIKKEKYPKFIR